MPFWNPPEDQMALICKNKKEKKTKMRGQMNEDFENREICDPADCFQASSLEPRLCGGTRLPWIRDLGTRMSSLEPSLQAEGLNMHKDCM